MNPLVDTSGIPRPGDVLAGKYQVEEVLGAGGMGVVVAARHLVLRQRVALKFLRSHAAMLPEAYERFLREARAAATIQSEHVARAVDVGTFASGAPYIVMEHLTGMDLGKMLKMRGRVPLPDAVDLVLQACEAIAEAHVLGIVHRDLKPANLFLATRPDGSTSLKVLDFGLSKLTMTNPDDATEASLTATSSVIGSPHYMSPEQIRGLKYADARADIWALGVIFFQLVTGRRPFEGDGMPAVFASIAADVPPRLRTFLPGAPPQLEALVERCLEKDPGRRVQSVAELAQHLAPFGTAGAAISLDRILKLQAGAVAYAYPDSTATAVTAPAYRPPAVPTPPTVTGPPSGTPTASAFVAPTAPAAFASGSHPVISTRISTVSGEVEQTAGAVWANTSAQPAQRKTAILVMAGACLVVGGLLAAGLTLGMRRSEPATASQPASAVPAQPETQPGPPPSVAAAAPQPTSSAAPVPATGAAEPVQPAASASARLAQPPGRLKPQGKPAAPGDILDKWR
jgi:serine/threonine-protein kinase